MNRTRATVAVMAVGLLLALAAQSAAQEAVRVKANRTPLRAEPSSASTAVTFYQAGTTLQVIEAREGWYKVRDPQTRREGYIMAVLVEPARTSTAQAPAGGKPGTATARPPAGGKPGTAPIKAKTAPKAPVGIRVVADAGAVWFIAAESFEAVTDSKMRVQYGGGLQAVNLWKGLFAEAAAGRSRLTGSRVMVYQGTSYDLGIPMTLTFTPIEAGLGWRTPLGKHVHSYVGGGVTFMRYQEESDFAKDGENVDETHTGFYASAGLELSVTKWIHLRGEARFTGLPGAIGKAGVSKDFDETNLGGFGVAVKLAIGK